jgi:4-hydroxy-tetrahydrodipicolinate synthase
MLPPFYYKGVSDEGLFRNFSEIDRARRRRAPAPVPVSHPAGVERARSRSSLIEQLLARYPASSPAQGFLGDWTQHQGDARPFKDRSFDVFAGSEVFLLDDMRAGGKGCITATGNVNPGRIDRGLPQLAPAEPTAPGRHHRDAQDRAEAADDPALKAITAHFGNDAQWKAVRPPLSRADRRAGAAVESPTEKRAGFSMPSRPRGLESARSAEKYCKPLARCAVFGVTRADP